MQSKVREPTVWRTLGAIYESLLAGEIRLRDLPILLGLLCLFAGGGWLKWKLEPRQRA